MRHFKPLLVLLALAAATLPAQARHHHRHHHPHIAHVPLPHERPLYAMAAPQEMPPGETAFARRFREASFAAAEAALKDELSGEVVARRMRQLGEVERYLPSCRR